MDNKTAEAAPANGWQSTLDTDTPLQPDLNDLTAQASSAAQDAIGAATTLGDDVTEAARTATRAAKAQASEFVSDVGHELGKTAEQQKKRGVEGIQALARAITSAAGEIEGQSPMVARYIRDTAGKVEQLSGNLNGRDVNELMQAAVGLARKNPALFIGGAVAAGFALSRFLKSSAPAAASSPRTGGSAGGGASSDMGGRNGN